MDFELSATDSTGQIDKLVLVVHGVGDPQPGETLSVFARSLAEHAAPLEENQQVSWLHEKSQATDHIKTFAAHSRHLQTHGQHLKLIEVFWGDLSRIRKGSLGIVRGLFQILFGLRYVAYIAADQPGRAAMRLKQLGLISSKILHGPVLAVNFFLGILTVALSFTQIMWGHTHKGFIWLHIVLAGCCLVAILFATIGCRLTRSRVIERFCFWVNVTALFIGGLAVIKTCWLDRMYPEMAVYDCVHPGLVWYCRILVVILGMLWFIEMLVLVGMAKCWLGGMMHPRVYRPALHVAFLLPALAVGIWGQVLPMAWLLIKARLENVEQLPEYAAIFDEAIPLLGIQLIMMFAIGLIALWVVHRYFSWSAQATIEKFEMGDRAPRLIVHPILQTTLAACTMAGIFLVFTLGFWQLCGNSYEQIWGGKLLAETNKYAVMVLVPIVVLTVVIIPHLRPAFDIMLDVVNHFYFRSTLIKDVLDDDDEFDIAETTFESGSLFFYRRDAIHYRLKRILAHCRDQSMGRVELVIVAHSQGTMIAIEVLNDPEMAWLDNCFSRVSLVTMGSPLAHVYQKYFQHLYPPVHHTYWTQLRERVDHWSNIFRIDDFVGSEIQFPAKQQIARPITFDQSVGAPTTYSNHPVGPRGHISYWTDREVLEVLRRELLTTNSERGRQSDASKAA